MKRRELRDEDVKELVFESITLIKKAQNDLLLSISPNIYQTEFRLKTGILKADYLNHKWKKVYTHEYGSFIPPSTIFLDKKLPFCDRPLDMPHFCETMSHYTAVHEVIHADDHTGGDKLLLATRKHIFKTHKDKLKTGMEFIKNNGGKNSIRSFEDLASLWAIQYVDMVTHYRAYVVLRHKKYKKLDQIWSQLDKDYFPPNLLTCIEIEKGTKHVFHLFTDMLGEYCLIEALDDYKSIKEKNVDSYTV